MNENLDWTDVCERLWGPDWIAPLSEVLHVNRRTVERWRSGKVAIPPQVERMVVDASPAPMLTRELGDLLRRVAAGEDERDVKAGIEAQAAALRRFVAMKRARAGLAVVAMHGREEGGDVGDGF